MLFCADTVSRDSKWQIQVGGAGAAVGLSRQGVARTLTQLALEVVECHLEQIGSSQLMLPSRLGPGAQLSTPKVDSWAPGPTVWGPTLRDPTVRGPICPESNPWTLSKCKTDPQLALEEFECHLEQIGSLLLWTLDILHSWYVSLNQTRPDSCAFL